MDISMDIPIDYLACLWLTCKIATTIPQSTTGGRLWDVISKGPWRRHSFL